HSPSFLPLLPRPPPPTLFPYTTLFRSPRDRRQPLLLADRELPAVRALLVPADLYVTAIDLVADPHVARRQPRGAIPPAITARRGDRKSTRLNSSHVKISYAVFCLKKKT